MSLIFKFLYIFNSFLLNAIYIFKLHFHLISTY